MVRTGWIKWYNEASAEERVDGCKTNHNYVGVEGTEESIPWLWNHHFSALVGDNMAFEAWPATGKWRKCWLETRDDFGCLLTEFLQVFMTMLWGCGEHRWENYGTWRHWQNSANSILAGASS